MSTADEIAQLDQLRRSGVLSEAEFEAQKAKVLSGGLPLPPPPLSTLPPPPAQPQMVGGVSMPDYRPSVPLKSPMSSKQKLLRVAVAGVVLLVIIIIVATSSSGPSGPSANVTGKVTSVVALDGNTVRIYVNWTNHGKAAGSATCIFNTTVDNQFGDEVNIEVNSTGTNGNIKPGKSQLLYQDIGVNNGDAQFVKPKDVQIVNC